MIKKHAVIFSVLIHILLVIIVILIKLDKKPVKKDREIVLDYIFIDESQTSKEDQSTIEAVQKVEKIILPPVELPRENINETASSVIIPDTNFTTIQSLAFMPRDSLTALDSLLLINPNLLALRTVFMEGIRNDMPEDTSKKWKQITPVGIEEYIRLLKYSDGFKNSQMQEKYNNKYFYLTENIRKNLFLGAPI